MLFEVLVLDWLGLVVVIGVLTVWDAAIECQ